MAKSSVMLYVMAIFLFGTAKSEKKLVDIDSKLNQPTPPPAQLPPLLNLPFLQNLLPGSNNGYRNGAALPPLFAPQIINPLTRDIFSLARDTLKAFNTLFPLPGNMNYEDQIKQVQEMLRTGQIPKQYQQQALSFLSLLRDQPIVRDLQKSVKDLGELTSFSFSSSGKGLDDLRLKSDFSLPATMFTPAMQSSFAVASNGDAVAADETRARAKDRNQSYEEKYGETDENPFIFV